MTFPARAAALIVLLTQNPCWAQTPPAAAADRFRTIDYRPESVIDLPCRAGYATTLVFASDEEIDSIAIGDSGAWQATPSKSGNSLFLKPIAASATNMTVMTNARTYVFELSLAEDAPYLVRFRYPLSQSTMADGLPGPLVGRYVLRGSRALMPQTMGDDGVHVFIEWPVNVPLPAVYSVGDGHRETLLNGAMRGRRYVIDSINARLAFRRDKTVAYAERVEAKPAPRRTAR